MNPSQTTSSASYLAAALMMITLAPGHVLATTSVSAKASNRISGFKYQTCSDVRCVEIVADDAKMSFAGGGFSTKGPTRLVVREKNGEIVSSLEGVASSFHAQVGLLSLDLNENGAFAVYSLRDEKLTHYGATLSTPGASSQGSTLSPMKEMKK